MAEAREVPTGLPRAKRPLTPAQIELLKLIAERLVNEYLDESDRVTAARGAGMTLDSLHQALRRSG